MNEIQQGKVYLIGAGSGDVELMTLRAVRLLGEADVVLLDDLVNREVLRFVRAKAEVIEVGKRGGCKSTPQLSIHEQMLVHARVGKIVARLKGGDPFVFGCGGEEMRCLLAAGVPVEVVSGVTAGVAVPAALGIPVTHRDYARSVTFVTGHTCNERPVDWYGLAAAGGTLVIYMGITHLSQIIAELLTAGLSPTLPAAAIQHGTLPRQRSAFATLATLPLAVRNEAIGSPSIVIVGEVVGLASDLLPDTVNTKGKPEMLEEQS
ncbi:MAG: uroporphyrinogen-III C-methyltransferase [Betaproteobacteria bacterium HGW-Betaproteobacteria-11]|nr:MAG: uroporphyrinogen-III C-methyltransferase [Betaproteobacteria bacterium HGW-Betaproteobacteria-11]